MKIKQTGTNTFAMYCPACDNIHSFGESWGFNKDFDDKPNVIGSLLTHPTPLRPIKCHLHIRSGKIEYLNDCTHSLSGKIIDLPEIPMDKYSFSIDEEDK